MNGFWNHFFIWIALLITSHYCLHAQNFPNHFNLIPNSSFELNIFEDQHYLGDTTFTNNKSCWIKANGLGGTVRQQYYVDKHQQLLSSNPHPYSGKKNVEIILASLEYYNIHLPLASQHNFQGTRSYIQTKLLAPLIADQNYYLTLYVGYSKNTNHSPDEYEGNLMTNLGVLFTEDKVRDFQQNSMLLIEPQIRFSNWSSSNDLDTFQYQQLSGVFTASGGEQYITIGNFDSLQYLDIAYVNPTRISNDTNYYPMFRAFLDQITLVADTTLSPISLEEWDLGNDTIICTTGLENETIRLGYEAHFFNYLWNTGATTSTIEINTSGTYWCTVNFGCNTFTDTIRVIYLNDSLPMIHLGNDTSICNAYDSYDPIFLNAANCQNCQFLWSTGETSAKIKVDTPDQYWVSVSNTCGTITDTITILGCPPKEITKIWLPNAFTPNNDGLNDRFSAPHLPAQVIAAEMVIYNRYGHIMAIITDITRGWDGENADLGVYFYLLQYTDTSGKLHIQKGEINLIR